MATQKGVLSLSGKLDKQVYYQRNGKTFARKIQETHTLTENSRKSGREFGRASAAASLVQKTFAEDLDHVMDGSCFLRLTRCLGEVIRTAYNKPKGERNVADGDIALLRGFQLNAYTSIERLLPGEPVMHIGPETELHITLPAFSTDPEIFRLPRGAETLAVRLCCGIFDFVKMRGIVVTARDLEIQLKKEGYFQGGSIPLLDKDTPTHNRMLLIAAACQFKNKDGVPSRDRKYCAAKFIAAALVQKWKVVPFTYPSATNPETPHSGKSAKQKPSWILNK